MRKLIYLIAILWVAAFIWQTIATEIESRAYTDAEFHDKIHESLQV